MKKILVTGATGNNGLEVLKRLSAKGASVRAMIRKPLDGNGGLPGVEYATADFEDLSAMRKVLEGIDRVFLVTNSSERVEAQQLSFVEAARDAGVRHSVYLSQLHAAKESPVRFLRYHAVVEDAISSAGIAFTHLRPNLFMQGLLQFRNSIVREGRFYAPAGDARVSVVDVRDIAEIAVAALTQEGYEGKIYDLTGPEALTHAEMASQLSQAAGKSIAFVDIPEQAMSQALRQMGMPQWQADGLVEDYAHYRLGEASGVSSAIQDATGVPARTFHEFAMEYKASFLPQT